MQVHGLWAFDFVAAFDARLQWPESTPGRYFPRLRDAVLVIINHQDWSGKLIFTDAVAIVYYSNAVPWLVRDFSVDSHLKHLLKLQDHLDADGRLVYETRKYLIEARKEVIG